MRNGYGVALCFILISSVLQGQTNIADTIPASMLDTVTVQGYLNSNSHFLPNTEGTNIGRTFVCSFGLTL